MGWFLQKLLLTQMRPKAVRRNERTLSQPPFFTPGHPSNGVF